LATGDIGQFLKVRLLTTAIEPVIPEDIEFEFGPNQPFYASSKNSHGPTQSNLARVPQESSIHSTEEIERIFQKR